jgi:hypothetical protein
VTKEKQAEWESYQQYKKDYVEFYDLKGYEKYLDEYNLMKNFGFHGPDYYYVPSQVLAAKYNPPLQGDVYCTEARGCDTSLNHASALKYYGDKMNGKYYGYIPSTVNGKYFDHPDMNGKGAQGYLTVQPNYGYGYDSGYGAGMYNSGYDEYYTSGFGYDFDSGLDGKQPRYYARVADSLTNGFYVIGFY